MPEPTHSADAAPRNIRASLKAVGAEPEIALRTAGLAKTYPSGQSLITVFHRLDLEVRSGESVAIIGESGAGKSTLLHLLGGLDRPTSGRIFFQDRDISALSDTELAEFRNREIGFVWQTQSLLPEFTALENVMMPLLIRGTARDEAAAAAREQLSRVALLAREAHRIGEMSGGEQQRVALARALVTGPKVLLADEPTGSLDHRTAEAIMILLENLQRELRLTSILVTHNLSFARRCDRVLSLEDGRLEPWAGQTRPPSLDTVPYTGAIGSSHV